MMQPDIDSGRALLAPHGGDTTRDVRLKARDGVIESVNAAVDIAPGGRRMLAMPALVNAHDHGRGLHHLAFGARDELFETWRAALYAQPRIDPYLNAALAFGRLAQAGVGSTLCVYSSILVDRLVQDAEAIARAARDVGIRVSLVVPLRDQNTMALADDDTVLGLHDESDREQIRSRWLFPFPSPREYIDIVREVARRIEGPTVSVQYGPNSPQACSKGLLEAIAQASAEDGRRIHTHMLESVPQRQWADATFPGGILQHLDALGLLSRRFTGAHGIWLSEAECDFLAQREASIAVNTSSNLRLFSGLSPVPRYLKTGLRFAFGLDSFALDDDDDMFRELRVSHWVHAAHHIENRLTPPDLFKAALGTGFEVVNNTAGYGELRADAAADVVLLDYSRMAGDVIADMTPEIDVVLTRARTEYVDSLYVAGRKVLEGGRVLGVDLDAIEQEVLAQARSAGEQMRNLKPLLRRHQATLREFYDAGGHRSPSASEPGKHNGDSA